jgi:hypothetical protein
MKKAVFTLGILLSLSFVISLKAQEKCRVLMSSISVEYKGDCKKGLADGEGEAFGVDHYIGHFRKGFPDGEGVYTWSTGEVYKGSFKKGMRHGHGTYTFKVNGRDTTITGQWQKDKYVVKNTKISNYTILYKNNIGRITVNRIGDGQEIRIKIYRNGGEIKANDLSLIGDSGNVMTYRDFTGFDRVSFPFTAKLLFTIPNDFYSANISCELKFRINVPGSYEVRIFP